MPSRAHAREPDTDPVFLSLLLFLVLFKGVRGIFLFFFMGEGVTMIASSGRQRNKVT